MSSGVLVPSMVRGVSTGGVNGGVCPRWGVLRTHHPPSPLPVFTLTLHNVSTLTLHNVSTLTLHIVLTLTLYNVSTFTLPNVLTLTPRCLYDLTP